MDPIRLPANSFRHFYAGGAAIARFRGLLPTEGDRRPEDWVASTTTRFGNDAHGLSALPDGRLLRDAVDVDPQAWLGTEHVQRYGSDIALLVKLLDVQSRLLVHTHPSRDFAREHLGCAHGKTEAWVILETAGASPVVYVGFREAVSAEQLRGWVRDQQTEELLGALNEISVSVGDVVLVPAGVPHAIGGGILIAEVQEPTDFSLTLEWAGYDIDGEQDGHLGLGFDLALDSVDRSAWPPERAALLHGPLDDDSARQELLPESAAPFFRIERLRGGAQLDPSFAVLIVTSGSGTVSMNHTEHPVEHGQTWVVPAAAGSATVNGEVTMLRFLPPSPSAAAASAPVVPEVDPGSAGT